MVQGADLEGNGVWTLTAPLPAGEYEFKVAWNGTWDENYGLDGEAGGEISPLVCQKRVATLRLLL